MTQINASQIKINNKIANDICDGNNIIHKPEQTIASVKYVQNMLNNNPRINNLEKSDAKQNRILANHETNISDLNNKYPITMYEAVNMINPVISESSIVDEYRIIKDIDENVDLNSDYIKIVNYSDNYTITETKKPIDLHIRLTQNLNELLPSATNLYLYLTTTISTGLTSLTTNTENLILIITTPQEISASFWTAMNKSGFETIKIINIAGNKLNNLTFENNDSVTKIISNPPLKLKENLFYGCQNLEHVNFVYQQTIPENCFFNNLVNQSAQKFYDWLISQQVQTQQQIPDFQYREPINPSLDKLFHQLHISLRYRNYYESGEQFIFRPNVNQASSQTLNTQNSYMLGATSSKHVLQCFAKYNYDNNILTSSFRFTLDNTPFYIPFWENNVDNHELGIRIQNGLGEDIVNISAHTSDPKNLIYESDISALTNKSWKSILNAYCADFFQPYVNDSFEIIFKNTIPPQYH